MELDGPISLEAYRSHTCVSQLAHRSMRQTLGSDFFPNAVNVCLDKFTQLRREMPFKTYPSSSPSKEQGVIEIQFLLKTISEWETHKEKLTAVARSVYEAVYAVEDD